MFTRRQIVQCAAVLPVAVECWRNSNIAGAEQAKSATESSTIFADFENGWGDWTTEGDAFGPTPATDALFPGKIQGFGGRGFVCTLHPRRGCAATGKATSREFTIEKTFITFKIGGGHFPGQACLNLVVDGKIVRTATGDDTAALSEVSWDVSALTGSKAHLEIVDTTTSLQRGYIMVDDITFLTPPSEPIGNQRDARLDQYISEWIVRENLPAAYLAIVKRNKFYGSAVGALKRTANVSASTENRFRIGSVTKPVTSTLILMLVNDGLLNLDTHPAHYLPDLARHMDMGYQNITIRHLLTHAAGLPNPGTGRGVTRQAGESSEQYAMRERYVNVTEDYFRNPPTQPVGTYSYSNNGYTALGAIAESVAKIPYESLVVERVFKPLRMTRSGIGMPGIEGVLSEPWYYPIQNGVEGQPFEPIAKNDQGPCAMAQGGVFTTTADICRFMQAHMAWFAGREEAGLKREICTQMFTPPYVRSRNLAWQISEGSRRGIEFSHNGQNADYRGPWEGCEMRILPQAQCGIFLATTNGIQMSKLSDAVNEVQNYIAGA